MKKYKHYTWWRKTSAADLQHEMVGTTSVFGRDKSIKVMFKGDKAVTGDGTVTFPALDPSTQFETETVRLFRGWVDSESAIARFSDRKYIDEQKNLQQENPQLYDVFKAVEAARVEFNYTDFYYGAGKNLAELSDQMFKRGKEVLQKGPQFYPVAISMFARGRMPDVSNQWACSQIAHYVERHKVESWVDEIELLTSTQASMELARRIVEDLNNGDSKGSSDSAGEGEEGEEGNGYQSLSVDDLINEEIKKASSSNVEYEPDNENGPYLTISTEFDTHYHWSSGLEEQIANFVSYRDAISGELASAQRKLALMIQATQKISWDSMKERGRLDSRRLIGAYQGEGDVFKIKRDESDLDTAISLCIDLSGSMDGEKAGDAFKATIILGELLHKIGVPFEIMGFDATFSLLPQSFTSVNSNFRFGTGHSYARVQALRIQEFKRFGDRFFDARKYLYRIATLAGASENSIEGESVMLGAKKLMKRPEKRKILFVMSDGAPEAHGNVPRQRGHLKRTIKELERHIEVVGIGIQNSSVKTYYKNHIVIKNSNNLPTTMLNLLGDKLLPSEKSARI